MCYRGNVVEKSIDLKVRHRQINPLFVLCLDEANIAMEKPWSQFTVPCDYQTQDIINFVKA